MSFNKRSINHFHQERLAKEDIKLLIKAVEYAAVAMPEHQPLAAPDLVQFLIAKLKRMEKQK